MVPAKVQEAITGDHWSNCPFNTHGVDSEQGTESDIADRVRRPQLLSDYILEEDSFWVITF